MWIVTACGSDALAVLEQGPTPERGRSLSRSKIASALRRGGRQLNIDKRAEQIQQILRREHLTQPATVANAYGTIVVSLVRGARALYDTRRAAGDTNNAALRAVANRLVGTSTAASATAPSTTSTPPGATAPTSPLDITRTWDV